MMKRIRIGQPILTAQLVALCLLLTACATTSTISSSQSLKSVTEIDGETAILTIPPKITYERLENEVPLDAAKYGGTRVARAAGIAVTQILSGKGFHLLKVGTESREIAALKTLKAASDGVTAASTAAKFLPQLHALTPDSRDAAVLVQYYRVKVGPKGSWNFITGEIESAMSSTILHAALIDSRSGHVLWHNEVLLREAPSGKNDKFRKALGVLYHSLKRKEP